MLKRPSNITYFRMARIFKLKTKPCLTPKFHDTGKTRQDYIHDRLQIFICSNASWWRFNALECLGLAAMSETDWDQRCKAPEVFPQITARLSSQIDVMFKNLAIVCLAIVLNPLNDKHHNFLWFYQNRTRHAGHSFKAL